MTQKKHTVTELTAYATAKMTQFTSGMAGIAAAAVVTLLILGPVGWAALAGLVATGGVPVFG